MGNSADESRKINLIEVLAEDAEDEGREVAECPEYAYQLWSEEQIRAYFEQDGANVDALPKPAACLSAEEADALYPAPDAATFKTWFPGIKTSGTGLEDGAQPKGYVLCFANAGSAEDVYTQQRSLAPATSPLLDWCKAAGWTVLAAQLPGRMGRVKEAPLGACQQVAEALLPLLAGKLARRPYVVLAHSVGTWNAFEFLSLAREKGLPMPRRAFFGAFPAPSLPVGERPWRRNAELSEGDFQELECKQWDVNPLVFNETMWRTFGPIMRADFRLFDEYQYAREGAPPFEFPLTAFAATADKKVTRAMVDQWQAFTTSSFDVVEIEGHHLFPLGQGAMKKAKLEWLTKVAAVLKDDKL